ncbi:protein phosphatase 2C domain-containing protein [Streptomyces meridianus]|uniref:Protein phosphatase 2C domain-containing protein n=1 Tax=Streptomyces meridianus TaxID=2938945 RepID=A0ABT0X4Q5_9ACTN|nr:protein phosphatase 2C domain-containing protein [Streptomyces meridianus]MCM2576888.1 protein phosphatase 2C domain-containing protein [Streptomyces meridianus]
MTQQGERRGAGEDDWWGELYGGGPRDAGPSGADDSVDGRFDSAARVVGAPPGHPPRPPSPRRPERSMSPGERRQQTAEEGEWWVGGPVSPLPRDPAPDPAPEGWPEPNWLPHRMGTTRSEPAEPPAGTGGADVLQAADPGRIGELVPDTVLDGGRHGDLTLRAASQRGEEARRQGGPRGDALLTARFGTGRHALLLIATAAPAPGTGNDRVAGPPPGHHTAAQEVCRRIAEAVGRNRAALVQDLAAGRHREVRSGLRRLTDRLGQRPSTGFGPERALPTPELRCLLVPADPGCPGRVFFGTGRTGLFRLRDGCWQALDPDGPPEGTTPADDVFAFRVCRARPRDVLLLCGPGPAAAMQGDPALAGELARRWAHGPPREPSAFLDDLRLRAAAHRGDRTAAAVWET